MATFAPPIRRGDFLYSSVLYADPGNGNHHPRASTAELAGLLRPEAPNLYSKSGKAPQGTPAKDPVWHWYAAQLIHYGLPVTKDKNGAKVRLLNALNQFKLEVPAWILKLEVPAWILKLEGELKKEWEGENRKMKKSVASAAKGKSVKKSGGGNSKDATQMAPSGSGINVNVNVSLGSGLSIVGQTGITSPVPAYGGKRKREANGCPTDKPTLKKPARAAKVAKAAKPKAASSTQSREPTQIASPIKGRTKQTARKTATPYIKREAGAVSSPSRVKKEAAPASSPYTTSRIKQEHDPTDNARSRSYPYDHDDSDYDEPPIITLSGTYDIDSINIDAQVLLDVYCDAPRDVWWATAVLQTYSEHLRFVIKMDPGPSADALGRPVTLGWRMRDVETDELRFGSGCTGEATFFDNGGVEVVLKRVPELGDVVFEGERMGGPSQPGDLQGEWDGFRREAYGR